MAARPKKNKANTKFVSAWIDSDVVTQLKAEAQASDRTMAGELNHRLKQSLKRSTKPRSLQAAE